MQINLKYRLSSCIVTCLSPGDQIPNLYSQTYLHYMYFIHFFIHMYNVMYVNIVYFYMLCIYYKKFTYIIIIYLIYIYMYIDTLCLMFFSTMTKHFVSTYLSITSSHICLCSLLTTSHIYLYSLLCLGFLV